MKNQQNPSGKELIYCANGLPEKQLVLIRNIAITGLFSTLAIAMLHFIFREESIWKNALIFCWSTWIIAPPIWFSYEYFYLFKKYGPENSFEAFKCGQELASRAWLGISAILTLIVSGTFNSSL